MESNTYYIPTIIHIGKFEKQENYSHIYYFAKEFYLIDLRSGPKYLPWVVPSVPINETTDNFSSVFEINEIKTI